MKGKSLLLLAAAGAGTAGVANAGEVLVTSNISTSTTWTADNFYNLQQQIYVLPGATLTIEPGVVVASDTGVGGSLAVTRGAQLFVNGTAAEPVIFTSKADVATWAVDASHPTGKNPKSGQWREAINEWGNVTLMGRAYISENAIATNTPAPNASNFAVMEGLTQAFPGDPNPLYGGGDDDDDSGSLSYLSQRYGGKVIALNNELNGLALGGIGRETDLTNFDLMNNVDDGIEIWGGTVNLKYLNIWNIGDDSLDIDQGYRGKIQFGLIVQGYSVDAPSGSGVCDNGLELDGAEQSDYQPVTTTTFYNLTLIGQPAGGDHLSAWRDNARVQIRNSILMDAGRNVVNLDNVDGDGGNGYGFNGTLSWAATWATDYNAVPAHPNDPAIPADFYKAQTSGKLSEIKDSVFFRNQFASAYNEANNVGVFAAANDNVLIPGFAPEDAPIRGIFRGPAVVKGGRTMLPVIGLDPRAANEATTSVGTAPADGFFTQAQYRGAFDATTNWALGWTAADAFGYFQPAASVAQRNSAFNVPNSLATNGLPTIGNASFAFVASNPTAGCGVTPGSPMFVFLTVNGPLNLLFPSWGCGGGLGEILVNPPTFQTLAGTYTGVPSSVAAPIPNDLDFAGLAVSAQVAFFGLGAFDVRLGSAVDIVAGL
ncbi:MAG TPA: hypothetical protein VJP77_07535 [Planctomycetota bacterium]|nr:hypothetical protein [Planctomycetota bacterium]